VLGIQSVCGNALSLPFGDQLFDLVVSTQVVEHVPDDHAFVSEIQRVLSFGGIAIVSSVLKLRYGWYFYRNRLGEWVLDPTHIHEYRSVGEFLVLFRPPLSIVDVRVDRFRFSVAAFLYRLLLRSSIVSRADPTFFSETGVGRLVSALRVAIPQYRRVTAVLAKR
jgi:SAM-dependent methyltransferase